MKTKSIGLVIVLFLLGTTWAQDMSIEAKTEEHLSKGDCFVISNEAFEYGLVFASAIDVSPGMDSILGTKIYNFIPVMLNAEEEGLGQFLQGFISIRCMDIEGPQCGHYEFQSMNKDGIIDTVLSQLTYVGTVNYPTAYHRDMTAGGNIYDVASFKALFDEYWQEDVIDSEEWKLYKFLDVMTLKKGLNYSSFSQE